MTGGRRRGDKAARQICRSLISRGCTVHRYDALSTSSIYLKVDWGAGLSIRIADHEGYSHLNYRFNVDTSRDSGVRRIVCERDGRGFTRAFYGMDSIGELVGDVMRRKGFEIERLGEKGYAEKVEALKTAAQDARSGFWSHPGVREIAMEGDGDGE